MLSEILPAVFVFAVVLTWAWAELVSYWVLVGQSYLADPGTRIKLRPWLYIPPAAGGADRRGRGWARPSFAASPKASPPVRAAAAPA